MKKQFLLICSIIIGLNSYPQVSDWNNGGGNSERNGLAFVNGPDKDSILWQATPEGMFGMPVYIEGNKLVTMRFLGMENAPIVCYDLNTGELLWQKEITDLTGRSLPIGFRDGQVYAMRLTESLNDSLYALNAEDGSKVWTSDITIDTYITVSANFDVNGDLFVESFSSDPQSYKMNKINHLTGELIWGTNIMPILVGGSELTIYGNIGYYIGQTGGIVKVFAMDLETGLIRYSHPLTYTHGTAIPECPVMVGPDGTIYAHVQSDNITALVDNGDSLSVLWITDIYGNAPFSHMCIGSDGSVYAPSDGKIIRLNPATGEILNTSPTVCSNPDLFMFRAAASQNGIIYATNGESGIYAFTLDLKEIWSDYVPNVNTSGAVIGSNGLVAVAGTDIIKVYVPSLSVSINDLKPEAPIVFYPNPVKDYLQVQIQQKQIGPDYYIADQTGRIVLKGRLINEFNTLDLTSLGKGCYFLTIGSNKGSNYKLIKQ